MNRLPIAATGQETPILRGVLATVLRTAALQLLASFVCALPLAVADAPHEQTPSLSQVIRTAQRKVVKIYGAGGLRQLEAYQTGILISPRGEVVTLMSYVLDTDDLVVVLDDGRKFQAEILGSDPVLEIALLKLPVDNESLPHFELQPPGAIHPGQRVLALSNLYGIAAGDEQVSALHGVVTAVAPLEAGRGSFDAHYRGPVYVVDAYANNPGAAGGALVDWEGHLMGILGKELKSRVTGAWLNYALPVDAWAAAVETLRSGKSLPMWTDQTPPPVEPMALGDLGLALVPNVLARTPPYVDSVRIGSPAHRAGLRADDLVAFVAGQPAASVDEVLAAVTRHERQEALHLGVLRDGQVLEVELELELDEDAP